MFSASIRLYFSFFIRFLLPYMARHIRVSRLLICRRAICFFLIFFRREKTYLHTYSPSVSRYDRHDTLRILRPPSHYRWYEFYDITIAILFSSRLPMVLFIQPATSTLLDDITLLMLTGIEEAFLPVSSSLHTTSLFLCSFESSFASDANKRYFAFIQIFISIDITLLIHMLLMLAYFD